MREVAGGFGMAAPAAKELGNGEEKSVLGEWLGGLLLDGIAVTRLEFVELFDGAEEQAKSREIDFGRQDGGFFTPKFGRTVVATAGCFLGGKLSFGGVGGFVDDSQEADALRGFGEALLGEVVADLRIGR